MSYYIKSLIGLEVSKKQGSVSLKMADNLIYSKLLEHCIGRMLKYEFCVFQRVPEAPHWNKRLGETDMFCCEGFKGFKAIVSFLSR